MNHWENESLITDLYDNDQKEGHISCKVDLMDLEHWGTQTKNQSPNNNLDGLKVRSRRRMKNPEEEVGRWGDQIYFK